MSRSNEIFPITLLLVGVRASVDRTVILEESPWYARDLRKS